MRIRKGRGTGREDIKCSPNCPRSVDVREPLRVDDTLGAHPRLAPVDQSPSLAAAGELAEAALRDGAMEVHVEGAEPLLRGLDTPKRRIHPSAAHVNPG